MKDFKNILIVRTDRIGDVVLTTPSIQALKEKYPQSKISILVSSQTKDLVEGNPYLDEVMVDDRRNIHRGWGGFWKLVKDIRQRRFDAAIVFHTKKRTNGACFLARIPCRVGYKNNKFGFLLTHPLVDTRHKGEKHESQYCLEVLSFLGIESTIREVTIPLKPESEAWADEIFAQQGIAEDDCLIVIHPGASDPSKRWPEHRFFEAMARASFFSNSPNACQKTQGQDYFGGKFRDLSHFTKDFIASF